MNLLSRALRITVALILSGSSALADIPQELQDVVFSGDLNARSSVDFRGKAKNLVSVVPKDSEGTVLETRKLKRTGSYGVKVRITKVGGGKTKTKEGDEVWVYFSQKDPWLAFKDKDGSEVQDPEVALTSRAIRDGEGLPVEGTEARPTLPTKESVKANQMPEVDPNLAKNKDPRQTEGGFITTCKDCSTTKPSETAQRNLQNLDDVSKEVSRSSSTSIPKNAAAGKWSNDPMIMGYSEGKEVKDTIRYGMRNKRSRSTSYCYRYVKRALMGGDMIDRYPPGGHARDAVRDLKAQGMINLMDNPKYRDMIKSPADVPKGAVIVYHNGTKESGDVQIKTDWGDNGGFVSDFYSNNSFLSSPKARRYAKQGKPYRMIGVMIKP
ncbi:hypothetical protein ACNQKP_16510 [Bdellovibrio bacteriovorus]|uniref:hypothetical protein n=1 Tax=Bdellovibrio bacteriovorus TaxID=959 RepID=UPI003AA93DCE